MTDRRRENWARRYAADAAVAGGAQRPSAFVMRHALALPAGALIVDVAGGAGRHAVPLAASGRIVVALDYVEGAVRWAASRGTGVIGLVADATRLPLREGCAAAVVCANYLDRSHVDELIALLRPGGWLIMETYAAWPPGRPRSGCAGGPRDPEHLLCPGELPRLVAPLRITAHHEGLVETGGGASYLAGVVAVRD